MSARERLLMLLVGGALVVLVSLVCFKYFAAQQTDLMRRKLAAESELRRLKALQAQKEYWSNRDRWLTSKLPTMGESGANLEFRNEVKAIADRLGVILETPSLGAPQRFPTHSSVTIVAEAKGSWAAIFRFLNELQAPGRLVAIDRLTLRTDAADKTRMHASITVAKWFAPSNG
jgi:hypothetical protein